MFAKAAVFFFALIALVNAAPIVDYTTNPGVRPIKIALPNGGYKLQPIAGANDATLKREPSLDIKTPKNFVEPDLHILPHYKRGTVDIDALSDQILNGLKSNGLDQYIGDFSARIQRLKDILASNVSHAQVPAEAQNLLLEYRQVLAGLNVNNPVNSKRGERAEARDNVVIDPQVLPQLRNFVGSTVDLLRALDKPDAANNFLSEVQNLRAEAQNGTLNAADLLSAARDVISSALS
jgi:hypothetical protein